MWSLDRIINAELDEYPNGEISNLEDLLEILDIVKSNKEDSIDGIQYEQAASYRDLEKRILNLIENERNIRSTPTS